MGTVWNDKCTWSTGKKENVDENEGHADIRHPEDMTLRKKEFTGVYESSNVT